VNFSITTIDADKALGSNSPGPDDRDWRFIARAEHVKCPHCRKAKVRSEFGKNRARANGVQSKCKTCDGEVKANKRQGSGQAKAAVWQFRSEVVGNLDSQSIASFADVISEVIKDMHDDGVL